MADPISPQDGILWRGWSEELQRELAERPRPVLLFIPDPEPTVAPFLRAIFHAMPANARLRAQLRDFFLALYVEPGSLPEDLRSYGAGSRWRVAILSPHGFNPMVVFDPVRGDPAAVVDEIATVLERLRPAWE